MSAAGRTVRALVALGGNLEPRRQHLLDAQAELAALPETRLLACSALHETAPVECAAGDPAFLNGACLLETSLPPRALLAALQEIERRHGRVRGAGAPRHAPRSLDLDLILHGDTILDEAGLNLPHPRAHERRFVLQPAAEIAPELVHPVLGRSLARLLAECPPPAPESSRACSH
ncbi:MAG: 2-amino-4-hydroxy-6-hydroxymethyldihydropteridine diphosphokinase [Planctomycetota bacterium]